MTRQEVEQALDTGTLWVHMANGNYWQARRNGRTQTWKTRPADFRIPIKFGFRNCGAITQQSIDSEELVISVDKPKPQR